MNSCVFINDLKIETIIGVLAHERITKQPIILDLMLYFDFSSASESDSLIDTLDYAAMVNQLTEFVGNTQYQLIEKLAQSICDFLFKYDQINKVQLCLTKPNAIENVKVGVKIERSRNQSAGT